MNVEFVLKLVVSITQVKHAIDTIDKKRLDDNPMVFKFWVEVKFSFMKYNLKTDVLLSAMIS